MTRPRSVIAQYKDAALQLVGGRRYGRSGDSTQDCIRLQWDILVKMYGEDRLPNKGVMHLSGPGIGLGSMANAMALVEYKLGNYRANPDRTGVYYVQAWNGNRGHCFALLAHMEWWQDDAELWILEATNSTADRDDDGIEDQYDWYRRTTWTTILERFDELTLVMLTDPLYIPENP